MEISWKFSLLFILLSLQSISGEDDINEYEYEDEDLEFLISKPSVPSKSVDDTCVSIAKGGVDWLLSQWDPEQGWGENTPRALIALAVAGKKGVGEQKIRQMELQLDVETTVMLLRNQSSPIHTTDIVLFVQALLAMERNPRDFYGQDLVTLLLQSNSNHPALFLGLCDARATTRRHADRAQGLLQGYLKTLDKDYLSLALKAYSCMKSLGLEVDEELIINAEKALIKLQLRDGSFGNLYTTSLVVQALATTKLKWNRNGALEFLDSHSTVNPNMVSTYLILLAKNSAKYPFIKELYPDMEIEPVVPEQDDGIFVQYSVKNRKLPDYYFTISVKMPKTATFFDVMEVSQIHDSKFKFESYEDKDRHRHVYSISGVPNDAEGNHYWHLCLQRDVDHQRHTYDIRTLSGTPDQLPLQESDHFIYWFRDSKCEVSGQSPNRLR